MERRTFRDIAADIRQEIMEGRYPTGSTLPPEPELAEKYGVSRSLANRALAVLHAQGFVRPQQGRGTQVTWIPPILHTPARYRQTFREGSGDTYGAFDAEIKALGLEPKHEITVEQADAPARVEEILGETTCLVRRRRLLIGDLPVRISTTWIPASIAPGSLEDPNPSIVGGVKSALASAGYPQSRALERIIPSRPPYEEEAYQLEISPERTVIEITHTGLTAEGRPVEVTVSVAPANYVEAEYGFPLD